MTMQYSIEVNNARLDAIETVGGVSAILKVRTGAQPSNCAAADSGTVLATVNLPSDWMAAASGASKAKSGTWQDASADAAGTGGHFRIYKSDGVTCIMQGSFGTSGTDMIADNSVFAVGQQFTITSFTLTAGNQ
jgi:hypothetical protein